MDTRLRVSAAKEAESFLRSTTRSVSTTILFFLSTFNVAHTTPIPEFLPIPCSLFIVKLPWQKDAASDKSGSSDTFSGSAAGSPSADGVEGEGSAELGEAERKGYTAPKGRPTPKRREVELERGVIHGQSLAPSESSAQARQKRKEFKNSMSKEEFKAYKKRERDNRLKRQRDAQAAMDRGDEAYLMARDKGEVRRFARDWIDSRRFISNFVMPVAIALLIIMLIGTSFPEVAATSSTFAMLLMLVFFIEGITIGRRVNKAARAKFPEATDTGFGLGYYAYSRSVQPRRWRTPRARVKIGADV